MQIKKEKLCPNTPKITANIGSIHSHGLATNLFQRQYLGQNLILVSIKIRTCEKSDFHRLVLCHLNTRPADHINLAWPPHAALSQTFAIGLLSYVLYFLHSFSLTRLKNLFPITNNINH